MRCPSRNPLSFRVKLLNQQSLIRLHIRHIVTFVRPWIGFDLPRFRARSRGEFVASLGVRKFLGKLRVHGGQIALIYRAGVAAGEVITSHNIP